MVCGMVCGAVVNGAFRYEMFFRSQGVDQDMRAFAMEDVDKDGRISFDEFRGPKGDPEHDAACVLGGVGCE